MLFLHAPASFETEDTVVATSAGCNNKGCLNVPLCLREAKTEILMEAKFEDINDPISDWPPREGW